MGIIKIVKKNGTRTPFMSKLFQNAMINTALGIPYLLCPLRPTKKKRKIAFLGNKKKMNSPVLFG